MGKIKKKIVGTIVDKETSTKGEPKSRNPNWTSAEEAELVSAVLENHTVLFGNYKPNITKEVKEIGWDAVVSRVNAVAGIPRDVDNVKAKYTDLKSRTKKKASAEFLKRSKTGGGECENDDPMSIIEEKLSSLNKMEQSLASFYGKTWILGIENGYDTSICQEETEQKKMAGPSCALKETDKPVNSDPKMNLEKSAVCEKKQPSPKNEKLMRAQVSKDMLKTQCSILNHVKGIHEVLKDIADMKRRKYTALGYLQCKII